MTPRGLAARRDRWVCALARLLFELFHYSSEESAKNIIRTNSLWASDAYEPGARREVGYPCSLLRAAIKRRHAHFLRRGERLFADLCSKREEALVTPRDCYPAVFVSCLTENIGSRKHWEDDRLRKRGYVFSVT